MLPDDTRNKIENITKGIIIEGILDNCTSVRNLLCAGFATSTTVKTDFECKSIIKKEQAQLLETYYGNSIELLFQVGVTQNISTAESRDH